MQLSGVGYISTDCDMILSQSAQTTCESLRPLSMVKPSPVQLLGQEVELLGLLGLLRDAGGLDSLHLLLACKLTEGQHCLPSDYKGH